LESGVPDGTVLPRADRRRQREPDTAPQSSDANLTAGAPRFRHRGAPLDQSRTSLTRVLGAHAGRAAAAVALGRTLARRADGGGRDDTAAVVVFPSAGADVALVVAHAAGADRELRARGRGARRAVTVVHAATRLAGRGRAQRARRLAGVVGLAA